MNRKGLLEVSTVLAIMGIFTAMNITYALHPATRADFQKKKAIELCETQGGIDCVDMIATWGKDDILDYIRDDEVIPQPFNRGYAERHIAKSHP